MVQRRYGPVQGAGVGLIEKDGEKQIEKGKLGTATYFGILERGDVGKLIRAGTRTQYLGRCGSYTDDSLVPDTAFDNYSRSRGAGELYFVRITDGTEVASYLTLKSRKLSGVAPEVAKIMAHNGGRWAGKKQKKFDIAFGGGGLSATTFDTGKAMLEDEFKGALLSFAAVPGKAYKVISNDDAGIVSVTPDEDMVTDYGVASNEAWSLTLTNESKSVGILIKDGLTNPTYEWGMEVYLDGARVLNYDNLSSDPDSEFYFVGLINEDGNNEYIEVEDLWTGGISPAVRPANNYGVSTSLSDTVLELAPQTLIPDPGNTGDGTVGTYTYGGDVQADVLTLTATSPTAFDVVSAAMGNLGSATVATPFAAANDFSVGLTITAGGTPFVIGDEFILHVLPLVPTSLVGGWLYPNVEDNPRSRFKIVSNTIDSITVKTGSAMTGVAANGKEFMIQYSQELGWGYDGIVGVDDATYLNALDPETCLVNNLEGQGKGLVKLAVPGVSSSVVQKAGAEYAESRNYQFRYEIPSNVTTEESAIEFVNLTVGRNDFAVVTFPSWKYVTHPTKSGLKLMPATGGIHGREALSAKNWGGYHKAAAGTDITFPDIVKLPTGDRTPSHEDLNPHGIAIIKFKNGNAIHWGDRTVSIDPTWKFKHHREQMSYYENDLREKFDWIIFAINDPIEDKKALSALKSYFRPELKKRALQGKDLNEAAIIKLDEEINTRDTRATGDMFAEISLWLADTVERFIITMSKQGIFDRAG